MWHDAPRSLRSRRGASCHIGCCESGTTLRVVRLRCGSSCHIDWRKESQILDAQNAGDNEDRSAHAADGDRLLWQAHEREVIE